MSWPAASVDNLQSSNFLQVCHIFVLPRFLLGAHIQASADPTGIKTYLTYFLVGHSLKSICLVGQSLEFIFIDNL